MSFMRYECIHKHIQLFPRHPLNAGVTSIKRSVPQLPTSLLLACFDVPQGRRISRLKRKGLPSVVRGGRVSS